MKQQTPDILKKIINTKVQEIEYSMKHFAIEKMINLAKSNNAPRGFYQALRKKINSGKNAVIAEIKKASPSKGVLRKDFNPVKIAKNYEQAGACCISVLTDKTFFQGDSQHLITAKAAVSIPIIRKDFIIDSYQVYETRAMGADCILLIACCLDYDKLVELSNLALSMHMDVLLEVHNIEELEIALKLDLPMIGINNRNLRNFEVCLDTTIKLIKNIANTKLVITESGISSKKDVDLMNKNNVNCFLVGEAFIKDNNPAKKLQELFL